MEEAYHANIDENLAKHGEPVAQYAEQQVESLSENILPESHIATGVLLPSSEGFGSQSHNQAGDYVRNPVIESGSKAPASIDLLAANERIYSNTQPTGEDDLNDLLNAVLVSQQDS